MSENLVKVRRKEAKPKRNYLVLLLSAAFVALLSAGILAAVFSAQKGFNFLSGTRVVSAEGGKKLFQVSATSGLQDAINKAEAGDIIELEAGKTYYGEIKLPNKNIKEYITIRSAKHSQLPAEKRVSPEQANLMARIVSNQPGQPAISTMNGAGYYRFIGIEFTPNIADYVYNLVYLAAEDQSNKKVANVPHHLEFDRCYIHPHKTGRTRRGVAVNSAQTTIKNSYISGFAFNQEETQAVAGWTGTKDVKLINNYLEGGAENVMFGGSDPTSADLVPSDIEVYGNYFFKPDEWKGKNTVKCLLELKSAKKVKIIGNYFENNIEDSAFRITVRNQEGTAPFSTIEDVLIENNIIKGAAGGFNILGKDDYQPSQTLKRLKIVNNLMLDIGGGKYEGQGGAYFMMVKDGEDILIANNTCFNMGNTATFHGDLPRSMIVRDNIISYGDYGIHGLSDQKSQAPKFFKNNLIINLKGVPENGFIIPSGNFSADGPNEVGFMNFSKKDFRLAAGSKYKGSGENKSDLGCDFSKLPGESVKKGI